MGIVGAVIMPHNMYLHSALVKVSKIFLISVACVVSWHLFLSLQGTHTYFATVGALKEYSVFPQLDTTFLYHQGDQRWDQDDIEKGLEPFLKDLKGHRVSCL